MEHYGNIPQEQRNQLLLDMIKKMLDSNISYVYDDLLRYVQLIEHSVNWARHCQMVSKNDEEFERFFHREVV